jgi:sugar O-acyltransferase (sialic acid O-acetyltransferase NeuD family)
LKKLAILGAGGHGKVAADIAEQSGWNVHFFDSSYPRVDKCAGWSVVGNDERLFTQVDAYDAVFIAVGNNTTREKLQNQLKSKGFNLATLIAPSATVSQFAHIGEGVLVVGSACINIGAHIHDGVIINTAATVDHDCIIDEFSHISPGVNLAGGVKVGARTWIGIGSSVIQQIEIGHDAILGAGSVVVNNLPAQITAVGCPAKVVVKK